MRLKFFPGAPFEPARAQTVAIRLTIPRKIRAVWRRCFACWLVLRLLFIHTPSLGEAYHQ